MSVRSLSYWFSLLFSYCPNSLIVLFCFVLLLIIFHIFHDHSLLLFFFPICFCFLIVILLLFSSSWWCIIFFLLIFVNLFILSFSFVINFLCVSVAVWLPRFLSFVPYSTFRLRLHVLTCVSQVKRYVECNNRQWMLQR
jgi:hypothetical protein